MERDHLQNIFKDTECVNCAYNKNKCSGENCNRCANSDNNGCCFCIYKADTALEHCPHFKPV